MGAPRSFTVSYGGETFGTGDTAIHGPYSAQASVGEASFVCAVLVKAATPGALHSRCQQLEAALSKRDSSLTATGRGSNWVNLTFGQNALNTVCEWSKGGDEQADTGVSRLYTLTFQCQRPAPTADNGLMSYSVAVAFLATRQRTLTISGEYRAENGQTALEKYDADIATLEQEVFDMLPEPVGGARVWELNGENFGFDRTNHILSFQRIHLENLIEQPGGSFDSDTIHNHRFNMTRTSAYPGDSDPSTNRPERIIMEWSCQVDKTKKLGAQELSDLYEDTIFPWMKEQMLAAYQPSQFGVTEHFRQVNPTTNEINARVTVAGYFEGSDLLESRESRRLKDTRGIDYTQVWGGDELDAYADQGFMVRLRFTSKTEIRLGKHDPRHLLQDGEVQVSGWNKLDGDTDAVTLYEGEGESRVEKTILVEALIERFTKTPTGGNYTVARPHPDQLRDGGSATRPGGSVPPGRGQSVGGGASTGVGGGLVPGTRLPDGGFVASDGSGIIY